MRKARELILSKSAKKYIFHFEIGFFLPSYFHDLLPLTPTSLFQCLDRVQISGGARTQKVLKMFEYQACEGKKVLKMLNPKNSGGATAPVAPLLI